MRETSINAECTSNVYNRWGVVDDPKDLIVGKKYAVDYCVIHSSYTHKHLESVWFLNLHVAAESNQTVSHRPQTPFLVF